MKKYQDALGRDLTIKYTLGGTTGTIVCCELHINKLNQTWMPKIIKNSGLGLFPVHYKTLPFDGLKTFREMNDEDRHEWILDTIHDYNTTKINKKVVQKKMNELNLISNEI